MGKNFFGTYLSKYIKTNKTRIENTLAGKMDSVPVYNVSKIRAVTQSQQDGSKTVRISYRDPDDAILNGVTMSKWQKTVLVAKAGSYPTSPEDGTVIFTNTTRNYYDTRTYVYTVPADDENIYYFQFFPYNEFGIITDNSKEDASANRFVMNELNWLTIHELIQSGEIQTTGGLTVGGILIAKHSAFKGTTANPAIQFRIVGFDVADVNYEGNPNGNPQHSMTLWSEYYLGTKQFCPAEKEYALTEDTTFNTEELLNLVILNSSGAVSSQTAYRCYDTTKTGNERTWRTVNGANILRFNPSTSKWEVRKLSDFSIVYSTKDANEADPFDEFTSTSEMNIANFSTDFKWSKSGNNYVAIMVNKKYYSYDDGSGYTVIQNISNKGIIPADVSAYEKNYNTNYGNGHNIWKTSPLRQYLNSDKAGGTWYVKGRIFHNNPSYRNDDGFIKGFTEEDFVNNIAVVRNYTERNTTTDGGGYDITYDKAYLPSYREVSGNGNGSPYGDDGVYKACGDFLPYLQGVDSTTLNNLRKKANYSNVTSFNYAWLRSPYVGSSYYVWNVNASGALSSYSASNAHGVAPLLTII